MGRLLIWVIGILVALWVVGLLFKLAVKFLVIGTVVVLVLYLFGAFSRR